MPEKVKFVYFVVCNTFIHSENLCTMPSRNLLFTSHFKRAVCILCRPCVDVHRAEGGPAHVDRGRGVKNVIFFVNIINGWPLMIKVRIKNSHLAL